jgi:hypothetical protein
MFHRYSYKKDLYNGDFRKELLPSNILLTKILEENELKKKFIKSVKKVYQ